MKRFRVRLLAGSGTGGVLAGGLAVDVSRIRTCKLLDASCLLFLGFQRLFPGLVGLRGGKSLGGCGEGDAEELVDFCRRGGDRGCGADDYAAVDCGGWFRGGSIGESGYTQQNL